VSGDAIGTVMALSAPLSFWGGVDIGSGEIIDRNHPQVGLSVAGTILVMPHGRGSSSSATVLAEMIRIGTAPGGLLLAEPDQILVAAGYVANVLYGTQFVIALGTLTPGTDTRARLSNDGLQVLAP
jgi:predicted aconitase with swiveling domain